MLAKIQNSAVVKYPYGWADFVADNNGTNYPSGTDMLALFPQTAAAAGGFELVDVAPAPQPAYSADTQTCAEGTPAVVSGVWTQTWVVADKALTDAQAGRSSTLRAACAAAITGGYTSSALGAAHTYPSGPTDQANMAARVRASLLPNLPAGWVTPFWCADSSGAWSFAPHSAAQIQQADVDGNVWIIDCQSRLQTLLAQVSAATTVAAVQAVNW